MVTPAGPVGAQVRVFLQTRGTARATDYAFLGGSPPTPWWRAYRDATAFDHPTVLVSSDGDRWAAYLSGIPSARRDAVGTVVRYTLVLDGPCGVADAACVTAAVAAWVADAADAGERLSTALDARFPPDDVQRWLAPGPAPGPADDRALAAEVRRRALAAVATLPAAPADTDEPGDWLGALGAPAARAAFVARVHALVGGGAGKALLLNLVGGSVDAAALLDPASPAAVLVESRDPDLARPVALRPAVEAKKAPSPPTRAGTATPLVVAVVLTVLVVTALVTVLVLLR